MISSDKNFLILLSIIFSILFLFFFNYTYLCFSILFLILFFIKPNIIHLLNFIVFKIGINFAKIINPITSRIMFYIVVGLMALLLKFFKYDPLYLKNKNMGTWKKKKQKQNSVNSMRKEY